jgi:hypothetical protein
MRGAEVFLHYVQSSKVFKNAGHRSKGQLFMQKSANSANGRAIPAFCLPLLKLPTFNWLSLHGKHILVETSEIITLSRSKRELMIYVASQIHFRRRVSEKVRRQ